MLFFHLLVLTTTIFSVQSVIIHTPNGDILGYSSNTTDIFFGIPYGQISTRWLPAALPKPWTDVLNATNYGPICHQFGPFNAPRPVPLTESEDCLFLNIWVPNINKTSLPVRVWLHGGGYTAGFSNDYDGENLAYLSQSIIITINYRLGIFGFFPLPNLTIQNLGWIDQQLALKWIQENIVSFGGDKTNVMLFGQSAGGGSTLAHLIMESSWSLYSSVVLQSSGPYRLTDCKDSENNNWNLLETTFPECQSNLTCFQQLNASIFYEKLTTTNWITLWPCIGQQSQLLEQPLTLIRKGLFNKKANVLGGFNSNEGQSVTFTFNRNNMSISSERYHELSDQYKIPTELINRYDPTTTDKNYFNALTWLLGDYYLSCPNVYLFDHLSTMSSSEIYAYFFVHPTEYWVFSLLNFNATHLTEIPYVFHSNFAFAQLTPIETNLSLQMIDYFTTFHLSEQPWPSYRNNQTIIILDINNSSMKYESNFEQQFLQRCPYVLKYLDPDDCHAYLTEQECSTISHCQWFGNHCDVKQTSSA